MKKYKGISLIETLISLAIVGLSITALLPVMTVKKEAVNPGKGNTLWECRDNNGDVCMESNANCRSCETGANRKYMCPKQRVPLSIGASAVGQGLLVDASGFGNQSVLPLKVKDELLYGGQIVKSENSALLLSSNAAPDNNKNACGLDRPEISNLYVGDEGVIIDNNDTELIEGCTVSVAPGAACAAANVIETYASPCINGTSVSYNGKTTSSTEHIYSVKNGGNEYISVNTGRNVIGIGENATKPIALTHNSPGGGGSIVDVIAIATNSGVKSGDIPDHSLMIGKLNTGNDSLDLSNGYVISKNGTDGDYRINAGLKVGGGTGQISATAYIVGSDRNLKDVLGKYTRGINEILGLKPVNFTYKSDNNNTEHVGVIAQDLQKIFPESVSENKETGYLSVNTDGIFYALLNSIKTLNKKNEELEKQNVELENKIAQLREIRDRLRAEKGGHGE